jgi:type I restriction enzyme, S subunit
MNSSLRELSDIEYGASPKEIRADDKTSIGIYGTSGFLGHATRSLFNGPLVVVARKGTLDNPIYVKGDCWVIDTAFAVLPKAGVEAKWLYYQLSNYDLKKLNESTGVPSISREYLYRLAFKNPGGPHQRKIARILTAIDGAIKQTEETIEKLKKIKQGMMHDLFTRGIDVKTGQLRPLQSDKPELYKNTELGWIPKDWKCDDLERFSSFAGGNGFSELLQGRKKGDFPFYKVSDMNLPGNEKYLNNANNYVMKNDVANKGWVIAPTEGIAFAKVGAALLLNRRRILCVDSLVDNNMMVAVAKEGCLFLWLYWWLLQVDFSMFVQPGAVPSVNQSQLKKLKISIPSDIEEQKAIADSLESMDKRELAERNTLSKTILLKHGLMQDLLTGKVPVVPDPQDKEYQGAN